MAVIPFFLLGISMRMKTFLGQGWNAVTLSVFLGPTQEISFYVLGMWASGRVLAYHAQGPSWVPPLAPVSKQTQSLSKKKVLLRCCPGLTSSAVPKGLLLNQLKKQLSVQNLKVVVLLGITAVKVKERSRHSYILWPIALYPYLHCGIFLLKDMHLTWPQHHKLQAPGHQGSPRGQHTFWRNAPRSEWYMSLS